VTILNKNELFIFLYQLPLFSNSGLQAALILGYSFPLSKDSGNFKQE